MYIIFLNYFCLPEKNASRDMIQLNSNICTRSCIKRMQSACKLKIFFQY